MQDFWGIRRFPWSIFRGRNRSLLGAEICVFFSSGGLKGEHKGTRILTFEATAVDRTKGVYFHRFQRRLLICIHMVD